MSDFLKNLGAITMFIGDVGRSKAFYHDALGFPVVYEDPQAIAFDIGNTIINLLLEQEAEGLIGPAKVAAPDAGQRMQLTIWVEHADAVCEELARRGVTLLNGPMDRPWGMRTACFTDPDGYVWEIAQDLSKAANS